jgi:RNA polymerase sigma-70 factor (ECF subfamily)
MAVSDENHASALARGGWFATTHWSVVLSAREADGEQGREALECLCRAYWFPLYALVRRRGYTPEEAADLTQGFFARLLEKNHLGQVNRDKGRFRSFLLASLRHYLSDERDRAHALKRGGGQRLISLDGQAAEERYRLEPVDERSPDVLFDRRWALTILERAQQRLREECVEAGREALHDELVRPAWETVPYAELGVRWGMTESAIKSAAHRLRRRLGELLREEIARTVCSPAELDEEIRYLMRVLSG